MRVNKNNYITLGQTKITIKSKNSIWHLDFYYLKNNIKKRFKKSSFLKANKTNLIVLEKEVLPELLEHLCGQVSLDNQVDATTYEIILDDMAKEHFIIHKHNVRNHVFERDLANFNKHILPYFGERELKSIKPIEITKWQNKLLTKYARLSVQKYRSILFSIFTLAVNNDYLSSNPLTKVTAPKVNKKFEITSQEVVNPFTAKEINLLINIEGDENSYMSNFIKLMANTGMRPGEIIALDWNDIDFEKKTISVTKTVINNKIGLPKTRSSVRVIDLLSGANDALKRQFKLSGKNNGVIFLNSSGHRFYSHDIINLNLKKRLLALNINIRPLYQIRHSWASRMIQAGVDITWVSKTLGHKDPSITLKAYTKFIIEDEDVRLSNLQKIEKKLGE